MLIIFGLIGVSLLLKGLNRNEKNITNEYNMFFAKYEIINKNKVALIQKYIYSLLGIIFIIITLLNTLNIVSGYMYINIAIVVLELIHLVAVRKYLKKITK